MVVCLVRKPNQSWGQSASANSFEVITSKGISSSAFRIRPEGRYRQIKGSPYLNEQWTAGQVWLDGDSIPGSFLMRYNIYGNEMQFIFNADTFAIGNPLLINDLDLDGRRFKYLAFMYNDNPNMAFFETLVEGKWRLLARHQVVLQAGREPMTPYHPQNEYDRFVHQVIYYLQTADNPSPQPAPNSKREWLVLAASKQEQVNSYIKNNKLKVNRQEDLKRLVAFYNTLH